VKPGRAQTSQITQIINTNKRVQNVQAQHVRQVDWDSITGLRGALTARLVTLKSKRKTWKGEEIEESRKTGVRQRGILWVKR